MLAIGIVVDDAIVVVENVQRKLSDGLSPRDATVAAMREVTGPVVATSLVLAAVFVPVGFIPGITGRLYQQFAVTIAVAVLISMVNALTLSPALCASILRPTRRRPAASSASSTAALRRRSAAMAAIVGILVRRVAVVLVVFVLMLAATWGGFVTLPRAFLPEEDQGYFFVNVQLPPAAALIARSMSWTR